MKREIAIERMKTDEIFRQNGYWVELKTWMVDRINAYEELQHSCPSNTLSNTYYIVKEHYKEILNKMKEIENEKNSNK